MRKTLGVLLIMLLVAAVLPARDLDEDSPTDDSTAGRFATDFDNYLSTTHWDTLTSNVLFLQFGAPEEDGTGSFQAGNGYFLGSGMYLGGFLGVQVPATNADSTEDLVNTSEIIISDGQPIGVRQTVNSEILEESYNDTQFDLLFGLPLGDMSIGVRNEFELTNDGSTSGTINVEDGAGANPTGIPGNAALFTGWWIEFENPINDQWFDLDYDPDDANIGPFSFTSNNTSSVETVRIGGDVAYENVEQYGKDGFINDKGFSNTLTGGLSMPLGGIDLNASLGVGFDQTNMDAEGSRTDYERNTDSGLPEYQNKAGVISYQDWNGTQTVTYNDLSVPLTVGATLPVNDMLDFTAGVDYMIQLRLYAGGEVAQNVSYTSYTANLNGAYVDTTTEDVDYNYTAEMNDSSHMVALPLSVDVTPSEEFSFSVRYRPMYGVRSVEAKSSLSMTGTTTNENGDPTTPDTVVVQEYKSEGRTETYTSQFLFHEVNVGAQFFLRENFRVNMGTNVWMHQLDKVAQEVSQDGETTWSETTATDGGDPVQTGYDYATDLDAGVADSARTDSEPDSNGRAYVDYNIGFTYFFNDSMELDVAYTQPGGGDTGNIWDLGTWSALMTIRY